MQSQFMMFGVIQSISGYIEQNYDIPASLVSNVGMLLMYMGVDSVDMRLIYWGAMAAGFYWIYNNFLIYRFKRTSFIELNIYHDCKRLQEYMKSYGGFFQSTYDIRLGNASALANDKMAVYGLIPQLIRGQIVYFNDKNFNVSGYVQVYSFTNRMTENQQHTTVVIDIPRIHVYSNKHMNANEYFEAIRQRLIKDAENSHDIELEYIKIIPAPTIESPKQTYNHSLIIFKGKRDAVQERRKNLMETFFHPKKDYILTFVDRITNNPDYFASRGQSAQLNIILHGPPGTGKSSFVYRLASSFNRNIISIDLSSIKSKEVAYQVIQRPFIRDRERDPHEYVILLEEFDIVVNKLKDKKRNRNILIKRAAAAGTAKGPLSIQNKDNESELYLEDLLEIFQGPVPRPGQIIIATTNKFDEIYKECPALFRPGRLTPIKFDYLKKNEINQMIKQYVGDDAPQIDFDPEISTAKIIEILQYAEMTGKTENIIPNLRECGSM